MKHMTLLSICLSLSSLTFAHEEIKLQEAWKGFSEPEIMSSGFTHKLSELPLSGAIAINPRGWSGDYWSARKGGINYRWNAPVKTGYDLESPSKARAFSMSQEELKTLAPTEKYDLLMGHYDYPLVKEVDGTASRLASDWAGICHGWAPSTLYHNEPTPKTLLNPDGLNIPFGSGDIKALISYYYAFHNHGDVDQVGLRCFFGRWLGAARGCQEDLNAGAFHIVLTNKIGLEHEGFIMDIERWREVWNHPAIAYQSVILADNLPVSKDAATNAVKEMRIKTVVLHGDGSKPTWGTVFGTEHQKTDQQEYVYRIELNSEGKIIGGTWESAKRPDFIWSIPRVTTFEGLLSELPVLLND